MIAATRSTLLVLSVLYLLPSIILCISVDGCNIQANSAEALAAPRYKGKSVGHTVYSCSSGRNCDYAIHVIGIYEADSHHKTYYHPTRNVDVFMNDPTKDARPLVLVMSSHEPIIWTLHIPANVVINKVILSSTYDSSLNSSNDQILEVEKDLHIYGYGSDRGGGRTQQLLQVISQMLGSISSFTGTYQADTWTLNFNRTTTDTSCPPQEVSDDIAADDKSNDKSKTSFSMIMSVLLATVVLAFLVLFSVICGLQLYMRRKTALNYVSSPTTCILHNKDQCDNSYGKDLPKYHEIISV